MAAEWWRAMMDGTMKILDLGEEPDTMFFAKRKDGQIGIGPLDQLAKSSWSEVLCSIAQECDAIGVVSSNWVSSYPKGTALEDLTAAPPPSQDPLRHSIAMFQYKERGEPLKVFKAAYDMDPEGKVTRHEQWVEWSNHAFESFLFGDVWKEMDR